MSIETDNLDELVANLRRRVESLQLADEAQRLSELVRVRDQQSRLIEGWGDYVSPLDSWRSEAGFFGAGGDSFGPRISQASDRQDGHNIPFWQSEQELAIIRGAGEWISQADPTAMGALESLTSYVVGCDAQYDAGAKDDIEGVDDAVAATQAIIDDFLARSRWKNGLDREIFRRWRRSGEAFMSIEESEFGGPRLRIWEPSWIVEPQNAREIESYWGLPQLDWRYGVATIPGDPMEVVGYFGLRNGDPTRGEFIPAGRMVHLKTGDCNVKRGMTDFYPGQQWFEKSAKLLDRVVDGGAIQASIALIRKYHQGTRSSAIRGATDSLVEYETMLPAAGGGGSSRALPVERFYSGKVVDAKGADVTTGPLGQSNAPVYLDIVEAAVVKAVRVWGMSRAIATGNASGDSYASSLTAETPFVKSCESMQGTLAAAYCEILWKVADMACIAGRLPYDPQQLRQLVTIDCKFRDVAVRNKREEHEIRVGQHAAGLLSLETWSEQVGLSYEQERARFVANQPTEQPAAATGTAVDDSGIRRPVGETGQSRTDGDMADSLREGQADLVDLAAYAIQSLTRGNHAND